MNCEPHEVNLRTLPPGAAFELTLTHTTGVRGVVVQHLAGSTLVDCGGAKKEHWCYDAPVVPHAEVSDVTSWINSNQKGENEMPAAKKEKKVKAVKIEGRKPTLAPFVDGPFKLYASYKDKDYTAQVLGSGVIVFEEKEHTSPSGAAVAITKKPTDGYVFWKFNKNDKRVPLNEIRGAKSPLAEPKEKLARKPKAKKAEAAAA